MFVPEVVQTSAMDCGPASLHAFLGGLGLRLSYERLRELCYTDVDGTSIDTMEHLATALGVDVHQTMVPPDHLLLPEAHALPAIAVVQLGTGLMHFVVVWNTWGRLVQVMDPASGRHFRSRERLLSDLYVHAHAIPAEGWRAWAGGDRFLGPLSTRLRRLGLARRASAILDEALRDPGWRSLAAVDASVRLVTSVVEAGGLHRGRQADRAIAQLVQAALDNQEEAEKLIPLAYWTVRPAPADDGGEEHLTLRGAVLITLEDEGASRAEEKAARSAPTPQLAAVMAEPPPRPLAAIARMLLAEGRGLFAAQLAVAALAAVGVTFQALLFRALFDVSFFLGVASQRLAGMGLLLVFVAGLAALDVPLLGSVLRSGWRIETRLRMALFAKLPALPARYFASRLSSDLAERCHTVHWLSALPTLGDLLTRVLASLVFTTAGIIWLDPECARLALLVAAASIAIPFAAMPVLTERDLRVRTHGGALSRFYLDAFLGLTAIRAHGAERSMRRQQEELLERWSDAGWRFHSAVMWSEAVRALVGFGLAALLVLDHLQRAGESPSVLLLVYWALSLPALGQELTGHLRQYPTYRNVALRLTEALGGPEEAPQGVAFTPAKKDGERRGFSVCLSGVSVQLAGRSVLADVDLSLDPGCHAAIVGPSGAGKSTFVGLLLGWHPASAGRVLVDGRVLEGAWLPEVRASTAWIDPSVHVWNRSLLANLRYGNDEEGEDFGWVIEMADLHRLIETLPLGLQTSLGEGGGLVSGGEGQRVRLGRALLRRQPRLVILDEPFRGLGREQRRRLLSRTRELWADATLLCVTHDVSETLSFNRVLVVERGRIAEDGSPRELFDRAGSLYRRLIEAEEDVQQRLWAAGQWRRFEVQGGTVREESR